MQPTQACAEGSQTGASGGQSSSPLHSTHTCAGRAHTCPSQSSSSAQPGAQVLSASQYSPRGQGIVGGQAGDAVTREGVADRRGAVAVLVALAGGIRGLVVGDAGIGSLGGSAGVHGPSGSPLRRTHRRCRGHHRRSRRPTASPRVQHGGGAGGDSSGSEPGPGPSILPLGRRGRNFAAARSYGPPPSAASPGPGGGFSPQWPRWVAPGRAMAPMRGEKAPGAPAGGSPRGPRPGAEQGQALGLHLQRKRAPRPPASGSCGGPRLRRAEAGGERSALRVRR